MKLFILALCFGAGFAAHLLDDPNHYDQHSQSVEAARRSAQARFESFGGDTQQTILPSTGICGHCESESSSKGWKKSQDVQNIVPAFPTSGSSSGYGGRVSHQTSSHRQSEESSFSSRREQNNQYFRNIVPDSSKSGSSSSHTGRILHTSPFAPATVHSTPSPSFAPTNDRYTSSSSSSSSSSNNLGANFIKSNPATSYQSFSQRFGDDFRSFELNQIHDLNQYEIESERLARLQFQNTQAQSGYKAGTSVVDFGNSAVTSSPFIGTRSKSWEKSSKWSSQSEYDSSGQTKSSGFLTTAEGEQQTVNGNTAGYRAATTTIDDNGRRSTHSVYTP